MKDILIFVFAFGVIILNVSCREQQKTTSLNDIQYGKYLNKGASIDCFDAFDQCRKIPKCRTALRGLNKRCKVVSGRCSAEMADLPRCGQIMDHLFMYGFPETRCKCEHNLGRCFTMLNKIYANPCFASIKHLRKNDLFPQEITAYDKVSGVESTTASSDIPEPEQPDNEEIVFEDEIDIAKDYADTALYEEVFGDEGFAKPPPKRKNGVSQPVENNKKDASFDVITLEPEGEKFGAIKQINEQYELQIDPVRSVDTEERAVPVYDSNEDEYTDNAIKRDNTDYKLIAIILGALLAIFVLCAVIFFTWTRLHGKALYSPGKIVKDNREEEDTTHSKTNNNDKISNLYKDSNA